ncbi:DUF7114 family protein [Halopiger xanaduensis]|uniref:Polyprenyl synthetase n=1 Tax=Halopiger xanaduensis (strain DSM 18323 / JCM 14033 / SH-6) TaxID=797210 RepID=F8D430_HALXS|nr:hypothetical protein [Halopiger xanaduensis]AEH36288.1 hypothetical protein Halxa_1656 [Halopiger xanaduensis SH-6]
METADNCRRAAREAVADVEPPQLHDLVESVLDGASMVPGALTVTSAAMASGGAGAAGTGTGTGADADGPRSSAGERYAAALEGEPAESDADGLVTHAAGVQLIYEGLRLTRTLAHEEPWRGVEDDEADPQSPPDQDAIESDLEILAADILVSRGFYLLARTDAADKAVRTVQAFGRDQTRRDEVAADGTGDPAAIDANLERDILELAVETGAAAVGRSPSTRLLALADDLAAGVGTAFPPAAECLADLEPAVGEEPFDDRPLEFDDRSLEDGPTDRATSATDP